MSEFGNTNTGYENLRSPVNYLTTTPLPGYVLSAINVDGDLDWVDPNFVVSSTPVDGITIDYNTAGELEVITPSTKYAESIGNTASVIIADNAITIIHDLNTTDITVQLWDEDSGELTSAKVSNRTSTTVDVTFASVPAGEIRVVINA